MQHRAGRRVRGEVVQGVAGEEPVGRVERGVDDPGGDLGALRRGDDPAAHQGGRDEHHRCRRQQSPQSTGPEVRQVDAAGPADLPQQQAGDEVAREYEEQVHPDEATAEARNTGVVQHDGEDGDGAQALDVRAEGGGTVCAHG